MELEKVVQITTSLLQVIDDLKDDFVDYVCSGVNNPAPYCGNRNDECCDRLGWCMNNEACKGFKPKAYRVEDKDGNINGEYPDNLHDGSGDNGN